MHVLLFSSHCLSYLDRRDRFLQEVHLIIYDLIGYLISLECFDLTNGSLSFLVARLYYIDVLLIEFSGTSWKEKSRVNYKSSWYDCNKLQNTLMFVIIAINKTNQTPTIGLLKAVKAMRGLSPLVASSTCLLPYSFLLMSSAWQEGSSCHFVKVFDTIWSGFEPTTSRSCSGCPNH